ncbi:MAG: DUF4868 domain-containing protein [Pseudolactococcus laudensis]
MNNLEDIKSKLLEDLSEATTEITYYLETDKNVYTLETNVSQGQETFINPTIDYLRNMELVKFDVYKSKRDSFEYLEEEDKIANLKSIAERLNDSRNPEENIFKNQEKITYFFVKLRNFVMIYRYTSRAYLKSKTVIKVKTKILELVNEEDDRITLDKMTPDIIYNIDEEKAFLLNVKQAEYIVDLEVNMTKTQEKFPEIQSKVNIFTADSFEKFQERIKEQNKSIIRKIVKMIEYETYQKFVDNRSNALEIKEMFKMTIEFDSENQIIFDDETSIDDVLHLLSDDYVQSYLDKQGRRLDE